MKELSIEEKAKAYDEAIKVAQRFYNNSVAITNKGLEDIFPELAESEDERIRKALIKLFKTENFYGYVTLDGIDIEDVLTWLEKQCEQKSFAKYKVGDTIYYNSFGCLASFVIANIVEDGTDNPMYEDKDGNSVFQNDIVVQKPADKVEPKFKVGQTIKKEGFNIGFTIVKVNDGFYYNNVGDHFSFTDQDNWELVEQNSTWSEEDEDYYDAIIAKLEVTQDDALLTDNQMKFLKSLKDRYTWKPSNEQMEGIECTIKTLRYQLNAGDNRLDSLYNDLKKLREK